MKELLKLGVYTLLGTLLLSAPFAGLGMLSTHLVTEKTFWIQLIALFLSAVSLQGLWLNPSKGLCHGLTWISSPFPSWGLSSSLIPTPYTRSRKSSCLSDKWLSCGICFGRCSMNIRCS